MGESMDEWNVEFAKDAGCVSAVEKKIFEPMAEKILPVCAKRGAV
jgi:hypothetical protein